MEVERLRQEYDIEVEFAPFLLRPDIPPGGGPVRHVTGPDEPPTRTEQRGEPLGIKFSRGRTRTSYSHLALEAAEFASEYGDLWTFHRRMFRAYFEDLEDIGEIEVVVKAGVDAGLPEDALREALVEGRYRDRVDEGIEWTRSIGVTAIPTFVFDQQYGMVGAQELPAFRSMLEKLGYQPRA